MSLQVTSGCNICLKGDFSVVAACSEQYQIEVNDLFGFWVCCSLLCAYLT